MARNPDLIKQAEQFAIKVHGEQRYGIGLPYVYHLRATREVLTRFGFNVKTFPNLHIAALLHDTLEDTDTTYESILRLFGKLVAELVYAVTDELGRNRSERHEKTYLKIREDILATALKLADRIANVEHSLGDTKIQVRKLRMYQKEYTDFKAALWLFGPIGGKFGKRIDTMWSRLDELLIQKEK